MLERVTEQVVAGLEWRETSRGKQPFRGTLAIDVTTYHRIEGSTAGGRFESRQTDLPTH